MVWVYMLECADGSLYTGWTPDLEKRVCQHNAGHGSKYVRSRLPARLRYSECFDTKSEAMRRECEIKKLCRADKLALIVSQENL
jgi:putative endonuclease